MKIPVEDPSALIGRAVRFTGGKHNGFQGHIVKMCESVASVRVAYEGNWTEIVEDAAMLTPLDEWLAGKSSAELQIRGNPTAL